MLNYNLMIPVEDNQLIKVDLKENKKDTPAERHYKQLCIDELTWCRKNAEILEKEIGAHEFAHASVIVFLGDKEGVIALLEFFLFDLFICKRLDNADPG